jgi:hypothetical protein
MQILSQQLKEKQDFQKQRQQIDQEFDQGNRIRVRYNLIRKLDK